MKLQSKIFLAVFPLIVIPLLFSGGIAYQRLQNIAEETLKAQIDTLLQQTLQQVRSFEQTAAANVDLFSNPSTVTNYMLIKDERRRIKLYQRGLLELFHSYRKAYPDYVEIRILFPDGYEDARISAPNYPNLNEEEEGDTVYFQHWLKDKDKTYFDYRTQPEIEEFVLQVATPLNIVDLTRTEESQHTTGEFRGFLVITAQLKHLAQQAKLSRIGKHGRLFFADGNGQILFHSEKNNLQAALLKQMQQKHTFEWVSPEGLYYNGQRLHDNLWMFAILPESEISDASQGLGLMIATITIATIFITLWLLMLLLNRLLLNPLSALSQATSNLGQGHMDAQLEVRSDDEMGVLTQSFNTMANQLKTTQQQKDQAQTEALKNKEKAIANLQEADRLKDEFLANTSHELRTPLNGIIGIGQSLLDGIGGEPSTVQAQNLRMIVQSGQRLSNLVNDILDSFKMRNQQLQLQCTPIDMYAMSCLVIDLSRPLLKNPQVELRNEVPLDLNLVWADENRLQQILFNLIGNAIKFTHEGYICIRAKTANDNLMHIHIEDSGIGIAEDKLDVIFRAFEQADGSTAREYGGTGLGLSVTQQLVELHGGSIDVSSEEHQGTCFHFTLPLSDDMRESQQNTVPLPMLVTTENQPEHPESSHPVALQPVQCELNDTDNSCRVLLVDDEPVNLHVLVNYLSQHDYQLTLASSGQETLDLIESGYQPDIIILDVMMPRMSGFEVTKTLRHTWGLHELPILLLTAKNQAQDIVTGLDAGANDYLIKPVAKEELLARLRTHLSVKFLKASREAALEAARLKSKFLANMSHEIRTPMNAIIGVSDLLNNTPLSAEQQNYVSTICTGSETLLALINDILDFSRIEANKLELEQHPFSLRKCVEKSLDLVKVLAYEKDLDLLYWINWDVPEQIIGDSTRLQQMLVNLLTNAVKFTEEGEIMVKVSAQQSALNHYEFQFMVSDTGIGIPVERQERLFQSFSQVDNSISHRFGGTGLGLAICKNLSELMDGHIWVESAENQGASFYFTVKLQGVNDLENQEEWLKTKQVFANKRIAVYEENSNNRDVIKQLLNAWGVEIEILEPEHFNLTYMQTLSVQAAFISLPHKQIKPKDWQSLPYPVLVLAPNCTETHSSWQPCLSKPLHPEVLYDSLLQKLLNDKTHETKQVTENLALDNNLKILLVEDNKVNQKVAQLVLKKLNLQADIADNGQEALEIVKTTSYDVVLMDVQMPVMDGLSATRAIRQHFGTEREPWIIAMTANAMAKDKQDCFDAGMNDYMSKPVRPHILIEILQKVAH